MSFSVPMCIKTILVAYVLILSETISVLFLESVAFS